jgi:hypothetical protein
MFYDANTERALLHRDTDRGRKFDNKPLIKLSMNPKYERKIGAGVKSLKKSSSDRLTDMFGEVLFKRNFRSFRSQQINPLILG